MQFSYFIIKNTHLSCVVLTGLSFFARGLWMLLKSPQLTKRWVKTVPHVIDTGLFTTGIMLALTIEQYPLVHPWLTAKFTALLAYIILGSVALKHGKTKFQRRLAFVGALAAFFYIIAVATTHSPLPMMLFFK